MSRCAALVVFRALRKVCTRSLARRSVLAQARAYLVADQVYVGGLSILRKDGGDVPLRQAEVETPCATHAMPR